MKAFSKKIRRGLAGFLAFCLLLTSVNTAAFAAEDLPKEDAGTYVQLHLTGDRLKDAALEAIRSEGSGEESHKVTLEDLGMTGEDPDAALQKYQRLFTADEKGDLYEVTVDFADGNIIPDGAGLRVFVRAHGSEDYELTGDEELIFLFENGTEGNFTYQISVDDNKIQDVLVRANSDLAAGTEIPETPETSEGAEESKPEESGSEVTKPEESESAKEEGVTEDESSAEQTTESKEDKTEAAEPDEKETEAEDDSSDIEDEADVEDKSEDVEDEGEKELTLSLHQVARVAASDDDDEDEGWEDEIFLINDLDGNDGGQTTGKTAKTTKTTVKTSSKIKGTLYDKTIWVEDEGVMLRAFVTTLDKALNGEVEEVEVVATDSNLIATASDATLVVRHGYIGEMNEYRFREETVTGLEVGSTIEALDVKDKIKDAEYFDIAKSEPESLVIEPGENQITVYYEEKSVESSEMELGLLEQRITKKGRSAIGELPQGEVAPGKYVEGWKDKEKLTAEIILTVQGEPIKSPVDVLLVLDGSGSMWQRGLSGVLEDLDDGTQITRLSVAKAAADSFTETILARNSGITDDSLKNRVGVVGFGSWMDGGTSNYTKKLSSDRGEILNEIQSYYDYSLLNNGGTNFRDALGTAADVLSKSGPLNENGRKTFVIFMSDGVPDPSKKGVEEANVLKDKYNASFYTVGIGLDALDDYHPGPGESTADATALLKELASGSDYAHFVDNKDIKDTLEMLFQQIASQTLLAGTEAYVIDYLNDDFIIDPEGVWPANVKYDPTTHSVTWKIGLNGNGDITKAPQTVKIPIKLDTENGAVDSEKVYHTNKTVEIHYTDSTPKEVVKKDFGDPTLTLEGATLTVNYALANKDGEWLNSEGKPIGKDEPIEFRQKLDIKTVKVTDLFSSFPYTPLATLVKDNVTYYACDPSDITIPALGQQTNYQIWVPMYANNSYPYTVNYYADSSATDPIETIQGDEKLEFDIVKSVDLNLHHPGSNYVLTPVVEFPNGGNGIVTEDANKNIVNIIYIKKANVSFEKVTLEKPYDGTPLTLTGDALSEKASGILGSDRMEITFSGNDSVSAKDVKDSKTLNKSEITVKIYRGDKDVTNEYLIADPEVSLTISKQKIELTAVSDWKEYDGTPLTRNGFSVTQGRFAPGEGVVSVSTNGMITAPGTTDNLIEDHTLQANTDPNNYTISYEKGTLEIRDRTNPFILTVYGETDSATYDGTEKMLTGYTKSGLLENHTIEGLVARAGGTNAAVYYTQFDLSNLYIHDTQNNNLTKQYKVVTIVGSMTVNPRPVTVKPVNRDKEYDGTPLVADAFEVTSNTDFIGTDGIATATYGGSITVKGTEDSTIDSYTLTAGTIEGNYKITKAPGLLEIKDRTDKFQVTATGPSAQRDYNGNEQTLSGEPVVTGLLPNHTLTGLNAEAKGTNADEYKTIFTGTAVILDENLKDVTNQYTVNKVPGVLTIDPLKVTIKPVDRTEKYNGTALKADSFEVSSAVKFVAGEGVETATYKGSQLLPGESESEIETYQLKSGTLEKNYIITTDIGHLIVTDLPEGELIKVEIIGNGGTGTYDGEVHTATGFTTKGLLNGHYVKEGTLSAVASGTDAGTYNTVFSNTPVICDEFGNDVTKQYDITTTAGTLTMSPRKVTIKPVDRNKQYDGLPLTANDFMVISGSFIKEEGITNVVYDGSVTVVDKGISSIASYDFKNGTNRNNYEITPETGKLEVLDRESRIPVTVTGISDSKTYDGTEQTLTGYQTPEGLLNGHTLEGLNAAAKGTDVKSDGSGYKTDFSGTVVIKDENGKEVTGQYDVSYVPGTLTINPREVKVKPKNETKEYDGTPLVAKELEVVSEPGFVGDQGLENVTFGGSQTVKGQGTSSIVKYDFKSNTKESNYNIIEDTGTLDVTDRAVRFPVTVTGKSDTATYDGTLHSLSGYLEPTGLLQGHELTGLTALAEGTDATGYKTVFGEQLQIKDKAGNDVTAQYEVTKVPGTLTVNPRPIEIKPVNRQREYNGTVLVADAVEVVLPTGFIGNDGIASATYTGGQLLPGSSDSGIDEYTLIEGTNPNNYAITKKPGLLTVDNRTTPITVTAKGESGETFYNGNEQSLGETPTTTGLLPGHRLENLKAVAKGRNADKYETEFTGKAVIYDENGDDVTLQYTVKTDPGTLIIKPLTVTVRPEFASKPYDGTSLTATAFEVHPDSPANFVQGEGIIVNEYLGGQLIPGSSKSEIGSYEFRSGTLASNYVIQKEKNDLVVTGLTERIKAKAIGNKGTETYDGNTQTVTGFTTSGLLNGHKVEGLTAAASGINAATYYTVFDGADTFVIRDEFNNIVTDQYEFTTEQGTLTINPRSVTIAPKYAEKQYDGTLLEATEFTVGGDGFIGEDYFANVTYLGGRKTVGEADTSIAGYGFTEGTIPENYAVTPGPGTLKVTDRLVKFQVTVAGNSINETYDGTEHTLTGHQEPVGLLPNHNLVNLEAVAKGTDVKAGGYKTQFSDTYQILDEDGQDVTDQYKATLTPGTLTIDPRNVTIKPVDRNAEYTGSPVVAEEVMVSVGNFIGNDGVESAKFSGEQIIVGESDSEILTYTLKSGTKPENYNIIKDKGKLNVINRGDKIQVRVIGAIDTKTYDGTLQSISGFEKEGLLKGHTMTGLTAVASGTDANAAGESYATVFDSTAMKIVDENNNEVTDQYTLIPVPGSLTINPRTVTVKPEKAFKQYDGTPLVPTKYEVTPTDGFIGTDGFETVEFSGSQLRVGWSNSEIASYTFKTGTKEGNYKIIKGFDRLDVTDRETKIPVTVTGNSDSLDYNGIAQTLSGYLEPTGLLKDHKLVGLYAEATGTNVKKDGYKTAFSGKVQILDEENEDVTDQYEITKEPGTLTIKPLEVTVRPAYAEKQYDGTPLYASDFEVISAVKFAAGEGIESATYKGSQVIPGPGVSEIENHVLKAGTLKDNYVIKYAPGDLFVKDLTKKMAAKAIGNDGTGTYNGGSQEVKGFTTTGLLKGHYVEEGTLTAVVSGTDAGTYYTQFSGTAVIWDEFGNNVTDLYDLTNEQGNLVISARKVKIQPAYREKSYDGTALVANNYELVEGTFITGEGITDVTYNGSQTIPGEATSSIAGYQFQIGTNRDNYEIKTGENLLIVNGLAPEERFVIDVTGRSDKVDYNGKEQNVSGLETLTFTVNGQTFTVEGLDANASGTDAGDHTGNVTGEAVVRDAAGNIVTEQFRVELHPGTLTIDKVDVFMKSASAKKEYDGKPLTAPTVEDNGFVNGEGADYTVTGSQTKPGPSNNTFTYVLKDGAKEENYNIFTEEGTLQVLNRDAKYEITLTGNSDTVTYNGKDHTVTGLVTTTFEIDGVTYTVSGADASATEKNAGTYQVLVTGTPVVTDPEGNIVTEQFNVAIEAGTLIVEKAKVVMTSDGGEKVYDGTPLKNGTVNAVGFAEGEGASYQVTGSQTVVGSSKNLFDYTLDAGTKAENYEITKEEGVLNITGRPEESKFQITVTGNSGTGTYNGSEQNANGMTVEGLLPGHRLEGVEAVLTATDAGTYTTQFVGTPIIRDEAGNDVTDQYKLTTVAGTLTISPVKITVKAGDASRRYNGQPLTTTEYTITSGGFVGEEGFANVVIAGSQTGAGSSASSIESYELKADTKAQNYEITLETGTLTVTRSGGGGGGGGGSTGGGGSSSGGPGDTTTTITPEDVPLAALPTDGSGVDTWIIDDGEVPLAPLPKTGEASASLQLTLLLSTLMTGLYVALKKKKDEN